MKHLIVAVLMVVCLLPNSKSNWQCSKDDVANDTVVEEETADEIIARLEADIRQRDLLIQSLTQWGLSEKKRADEYGFEILRLKAESGGVR